MKKNVRLIYNDAAMEQKISAILKTVKLHMNGATAYSMQEMGLKYDQNYGVSIPDLRSIAKSFSSNKDLAIRLWQINIREMKILGTLLFPVDELDNKTAVIWQKECTNIELIEQSVMNLFQHWKSAAMFSLECINPGDRYRMIFGLLLAQRAYTRFNEEQINHFIIRVIENLSQIPEPIIARYSGTALAAFCRINQAVALRLKNFASKLNESGNPSQQIACQLIEQEIDFLEFTDSV